MRAICFATSGHTAGDLTVSTFNVSPGTYSYAKPLLNVAYKLGAKPYRCNSLIFLVSIFRSISKSVLFP